MGKPTGFLEFPRVKAKTRPVEERLRDYREVYKPLPLITLREQGRAAWTAAFRFAIKAVRWGI